MAESLAGVTGSLQGTIGSMGNKAQSWIDSILPPEKRSQIMAMISKFSTERPMLSVSLIPPLSPSLLRPLFHSLPLPGTGFLACLSLR